MVDASHGNSRKDHERQPGVVAEIAEQLAAGEQRIMGVMVESHMVAGRQSLVAGEAPVYGQSITDACIGWETSLDVLETRLVRSRASAIRERVDALGAELTTDRASIAALSGAISQLHAAVGTNLKDRPTTEKVREMIDAASSAAHPPPPSAVPRSNDATCAFNRAIAASASVRFCFIEMA